MTVNGLKCPLRSECSFLFTFLLVFHLINVRTFGVFLTAHHADTSELVQLFLKHKHI